MMCHWHLHHDALALLLPSLWSVPQISYNILINTAVDVGELEELPVLVQEMEEAGVEADHHTYAALMGGYAKAGRPAGALAFLEVMQDRGLKPDVHC
jgi:leucine-rich PPR motif-containing protein